MSQHTSDADYQSSLLAYARSHGLCTAYTTHDPLAPQNLLLPNVEPCGHDPDLAQLLNSKEIVPNEKLYLDKDCAVFLHKVFSPVELDNLETIDHSSSRPKSFKTDSPVLPTDPTLDSRMFTPSVHVQTLFDNLVWSDSDECNSSADFNWLEPDLATRLMSQTCSEKLQLTPKDLNFLQQSLKYGAGWEQHADVAHETGRLRRKSPTEYESPPLLARGISFSPGIPDSSVGYLSLATSPRNPDADILEDIDRCMLEQDVLPDLLSADEEPFPSVFGLKDRGASSPAQDPSHLRNSLKRQGCDGLKEELPLVPGAFDPSPFKRTKVVAFSDDLATTIPDCMRHFSPGSNGTIHDEDPQELIENALKPLAHDVMREVEFEQLTEVDSTARIAVPVIDQTLPLPPWEFETVGDGYVRQAWTLPVDLTERLLSEDNLQWYARVDEDVVTWQPFPAHMGTIATEEPLEDSSLLYDLDDQTCGEPGSMAWKPEGLRVLDTSEDDEDELPPLSVDRAEAHEADAGNLSSMLAKRKLQMEGDTRRRLASDQPYGPTHIAEETITGEREGHIIPQTKSMRPLSIETSLDRFIQAQTGVVDEASRNPNTKAVTYSPKVEAQPKVSPHEGKTHNMGPPIHARMATPVFKPDPDGQGGQFIVSSSMLSRRALVNEIQRQYPKAEFIDREFPTPGDLSSLNTSEADILLSPGTGLMITTLQQIKQKALPGQIVRTGVQERIVRIAGRYERLIVLVSEGRSDATDTCSSLGERDCTALASLTTLGAHVRTGVQIAYVPGGESELAQWTVSCMARYEVSSTVARIVSEETLWEMFLRRAGLNAFAAQAVLSSRQAPTSRPSDADGGDNGGLKDAFGLPLLLQMRPEDRARHFVHVLGGERLLERFGNVMDRGWVQH